MYSSAVTEIVDETVARTYVLGTCALLGSLDISRKLRDDRDRETGIKFGGRWKLVENVFR
jgi:hypothetical protein